MYVPPADLWVVFFCRGELGQFPMTVSMQYLCTCSCCTPVCTMNSLGTNLRPVPGATSRFRDASLANTRATRSNLP